MVVSSCVITCDHAKLYFELHNDEALPSVCLSETFRHSIKTAKDIAESPNGRAPPFQWTATRLAL